MQQTEPRYALTPMQQGMLYHHLTAPHGGADFEQIVCALAEPVEPAPLREAWQQVVDRHAAFRTRFLWEGLDEPQQEVLRFVDLPWEERDVSSLPAKQREDALRSFLREDRQRGFNPDQAPLMRLTLFRFSDQDWRLVWSFHHLLIDGRTFPIILRDAFNLYDAARDGRELGLPDPQPFRQHVAWLRSRDPEASADYWRNRLRGFATPTPLPGLQQTSSSGATTDIIEHEAALSEAITAALTALAEAGGITVNTLVQAAWGLTLSHFSGEADVVFGAARACRRSSAAGGVDGAEDMVGVFLNPLPVRIAIDPAQPTRDLLKAVRADQREVWQHEQTPLMQILGWSDVPPGTPLFESILIYDNFELSDLLREQGGSWLNRTFRLHEKTGFPIALYGYGGSPLRFRLAVDADRFEDDPGRRLLDHLVMLLEAVAAAPDAPVGKLPTIAPRERELVLHDWNQTAVDYDRGACAHQLFEQQTARAPDAVAVVCGETSLTYAELNARANQLAHHLRGLGIGPDRLVGVCVERSPDMMVAILGVQKAGGAYVPLDPAFPADRIAFMIDDAGLSVILTQSHLLDELPENRGRVIALDSDWTGIAAQPEHNPDAAVTPDHLAYVIYTSGSTGKPKGVMVQHGNVVNFFAGMDDRIARREDGGQGVWLAVTSLSFDISVLELFWTLARGFRIVLYVEPQRSLRRQRSAKPRTDVMQFSLFYFASDEAERGADKYRLLIEGAKFADRNGFVAVSTPERHFHAFGGLYPNPSVSGAALATITSRVQIRAGSVVLPLHHPIRIAEEWSLVDNLSNGRVGISFASGWQPVDFVIKPENYADRNTVLYEGIETVRKLWRGESVEFPGADGKSHAVQTLPRPVQSELPIWITTAGNPETWKSAGRIGANVLTHLLGQSVDEVAEKIKLYREARREAGHDGPGHVTIMLHTFIGDDVDEVREIVRKPMTDYLRSALGLVKNVASAWTAFKRRADGTAAAADIDLNALSDEEMDDLLAFSFERYFETSGLFGTPESCLDMVHRLKAGGVDEIACLIDFGVDSEVALTHLQHLNELRQHVEDAGGATATGAVADEPESIGALIRRHGVTHLQCTPSMAGMILIDDDARAALRELRVIMIGGEAFPGHLAEQLRKASRATIVNMYGPTETTIWSTTWQVPDQADDAPADHTLPIGRPIANTTIYILDAQMRPVPVGAIGELYIGGEGVTRGYHNRPELTAERFVPDPFTENTSSRLYCTGDIARYRADGTIEFLGRADHQVKIRGYRIELGEIEALLATHANVREAVVIPREDEPGDVRLVAYVTTHDGNEMPPDDLRRLARESLPDYMVPAHFLTIDAFPQTPNRKVDRKALPSPQAMARRAAPAAAAAIESIAAPTVSAGHDGAAMSAEQTQQLITAIWREVLGVNEIGPEDNFFDLGGHSLLAVKTHRRLKESFPQRTLAITDLFRFPTVKALAEHLYPKPASDDGANGSALDPSESRAAARRSMMLQRRRLLSRRGTDERGDEGGA